MSPSKYDFPITLSYIEAQNLPRYPLAHSRVGTLLDGSVVHVARMRTIDTVSYGAELLPYNYEGRFMGACYAPIVHFKDRDCLIVDGRKMEVDGKPAWASSGQEWSMEPIATAESFLYHNPHELLPYDLRHRPMEHAPVYTDAFTFTPLQGSSIESVEPVHLVKATFMELDGRQWHHELLVRDGRRIAGIDGHDLTGAQKAGIEICGFKAVDWQPLEPENSVHYREWLQMRPAA